MDVLRTSLHGVCRRLSFTTALYGDRYESRQEKYVTEILQKNWNLDNETIQRILRIKSQIPNFIEYCLNSIEWSKLFDSRFYLDF